MAARLYPEELRAARNPLAKRRKRVPVESVVGVVLLAVVASGVPAAAVGPTLDATWRIAARGGDAIPSELALDVTIEKGWHLNANDPDRPYLIPTTLDVDPPGGVEIRSIRYPEPVTRALGFAPGTALRLYEGTITITVRVAGAPPARFDATLGYQACNEETCLPPRTIPVPFEAARAPESAK